MRQLRRVQVKYIAARAGAVRVRLQMSHADRHGVHRRPIRLEEIDAFAVFCPDTDKVYYLLRDEVPPGYGSMLSLRLLTA